MTKEQEQTEIERIARIVNEAIKEQGLSYRGLCNEAGVSTSIIIKVRIPKEDDYQIRPFIRLLDALGKEIAIVDKGVEKAVTKNETKTINNDTQSSQSPMKPTKK